MPFLLSVKSYVNSLLGFPAYISTDDKNFYPLFRLMHVRAVREGPHLKGILAQAFGALSESTLDIFRVVRIYCVRLLAKAGTATPDSRPVKRFC